MNKVNKEALEIIRICGDHKDGGLRTVKLSSGQSNQSSSYNNSNSNSNSNSSSNPSSGFSKNIFDLDVMALMWTAGELLPDDALTEMGEESIFFSKYQESFRNAIERKSGKNKYFLFVF
jgi:hypothetical protein